MSKDLTSQTLEGKGAQEGKLLKALKKCTSNIKIEFCFAVWLQILGDFGYAMIFKMSLCFAGTLM